MEKKVIMMFVTIGLVLAVQLYQIYSNRSNINDLISMVDRLNGITSDEEAIPLRFGLVYSTFKLYNPETDSSTVNSFLRVVKHFELAQNDTVFSWLVGQICLESGARQYYLSSHSKAGKVVRGTSGEVGITQIMPSTAIDYLRKYVSDPKELYDLGVTDFSFINEEKNRRSKMIEWLSYTNNNLVLWGLMTRDNMENHGTLRGFVAYNAGDGGMKRFVKRKLASQHSYIVNLRDTLDYIADRLGRTNEVSAPSGMHVAQTALR